MKLSHQLWLLALINAVALLCAMVFAGTRLASIRHVFANYSASQTALYELTEIKAAALAASRADLLDERTPRLLAETDRHVRERWASLAAGLPSEQRASATAAVMGNWAEFHKNFSSAINIFAKSPQDAISIPERIYPMYIVPMNREIDQQIEKRRQAAQAGTVQIRAQIEGLLWIVLTPLLVVGGLVIIIQVRFGQRIRQRLQAMSNVASRLADGDLEQRLDAKVPDEIGFLAQSFNRFIDSFESILLGIRQATVEIRQHSDSIVERNTELVTRGQAQTTHLRETNQAVAGINDSVNAIVSSATDATESAAAVAGKSRGANAIVDFTRSELLTLGESVQLASTRMDDLAQTITQISNVSTLIKAIATQTNLLALNAAIEAARAGVHGRGFSVVADEVRALSERTAASISQIDDLLEHVVHASGEVVTSIQSAYDKANTCVGQGAEMARHILEIVPATEQVNTMLEGIADSTKYQSSATAYILERIDGATRFSGDVTAQLEQVRHDVASMQTVVFRLDSATQSFSVAGAA